MLLCLLGINPSFKRYSTELQNCFAYWIVKAPPKPYSEILFRNPIPKSYSEKLAPKSYSHPSL